MNLDELKVTLSMLGVNFQNSTSNTSLEKRTIYVYGEQFNNNKDTELFLLDLFNKNNFQYKTITAFRGYAYKVNKRIGEEK
jgi:hypothetical protein